MNGRLPEGEPSHQPDSERDESEEASHQLLESVMEGPRNWAKTFDEYVSLRYPTGGYDPQDEKTEAALTRTITGKLKSYTHNWLKKYAHQSTETFRSLDLTDPDDLAAYNELTIHLLNLRTMGHWQRVFDPRNAPKPTARGLNAAQVKLALESVPLLAFKEEQTGDFENGDYVDQQLLDIDTMVAFLQLMIDAEYENLDDIIITPAPLKPDGTSEFLVFNPDRRRSYTMTRFDASEREAIADSRTPGYLAQIALARTSTNKLSFWPEFNTREALHTFMMAKTDIPRSMATDSALEDTRRELGASILERVLRLK